MCQTQSRDLDTEHSIVKCDEIGEKDEIKTDNIATKALIPNTVNKVEVGTIGSDNDG